MTESDKSCLSDSLNSLFENCDEGVTEDGPTIEYHDVPAVTLSGNEITPESEDSNPCDEFTKIKHNPNEGMVIVQMDDGGPRLRRRGATEIVIPIDHVSSSEAVINSQGDGEDIADSSNISSNIEDKSSIQFDGYSVSGETTDGSFQTKPVHACRLDQSCTPNDSTTPSDEEPESENSQTDRSNSVYRENMEDISDPESDVTDSNQDDDEIDDDSSADDVNETTPASTKSKISGNSFGLSKASYLNICQKFKDGTTKLEEIVDARDRLGRHILRTRPHHPLSNYIALRMFSSLSANYRFRNIGYVNLDSLPARPNSANLGSIVNQQVSGVGDTVEISHANGASFLADETPVENDSTSPVCSTRFDFTPAARSKTEGAITACSEAANGARSVESGRENPQAKQDSEVRPNNQSLKMPTVSLQRRRPRQVLPPISKAAEGTKIRKTMGESQDKPEVLTKLKPLAALKSATTQMKSECHARSAKPGIPYQLRSVACYQDGKVDVSITGDKRLLPESEPLNVNITFIHRPVIQPNKEIKATHVAEDQTCTASKLRPLPLPKKSLSPALPLKGTKQSKEVSASSKKPLPPLRCVPRAGNIKVGQLHNFSTKAIDSRQICKIPSRKILPPVRNIPGKMKKDIQSTMRKTNEFFNRKQSKKSTRKHNDLNWDIVNDRAQWPPFNTHINAEASDRHQKIFADIPV